MAGNYINLAEAMNSNLTHNEEISDHKKQNHNKSNILWGIISLQAMSTNFTTNWNNINLKEYLVEWQETINSNVTPCEETKDHKYTKNSTSSILWVSYKSAWEPPI